MTYNLRGWHWLNAQLGIGYAFWQGERYKEKASEFGGSSEVMLLYSIGAYVSFR